MMQEDLLHKLHFLILEYYGIVEAKYFKYSDKGFCFSRQHFTRAPLNSWEAAVVGEAGQELVGAFGQGFCPFLPCCFAHW